MKFKTPKEKLQEWHREGRRLVYPPQEKFTLVEKVIAFIASIALLGLLLTTLYLSLFAATDGSLPPASGYSDSGMVEPAQGGSFK